jgi:hypothetical protein
MHLWLPRGRARPQCRLVDCARIAESIDGAAVRATRMDVTGVLTGTVIFFMFVKWVEITWQVQRWIELMWRRL